MQSKSGKVVIGMMMAALVLIIAALCVIRFRDPGPAADDPLPSVTDTGVEETYDPGNTGEDPVPSETEEDPLPSDSVEEPDPQPQNSTNPPPAQSQQPAKDPTPVTTARYVYVLTYRAQGANGALPGLGEESVPASAHAEVFFTDGTWAELTLSVTYDESAGVDVHNRPTAGGVEEGVKVVSSGETALGIWAMCVKNDDGTWTLSDFDGGLSVLGPMTVTMAEPTFILTGGDPLYYGAHCAVVNALTGKTDTVEEGDTVICTADMTFVCIVAEAQ